MSPGTEKGTETALSSWNPAAVSSLSTHGPLADRENVLGLYLKACQQDPTVSVYLKGSAEQHNVQLTHKAFKMWQSSDIP